MGNKIVLCVDDEETILKSLEMDLSDPTGEYQVELAPNGIEALELCGELFEEGHKLAVVISDHIMPEMKGDELLIKIHEDYPAAVNILLTGQSQIEGVTNAINHAALYRYIAKPWQKDDLKLTLKSALQKYDSDLLLRHKEQIIKEMNEKLWESRETGDETYNPDDKLSDEELYDQIYFSRFFQSLDSKQKKWFALASIGLINADKVLTKTEMNYLNSIVRSDREEDRVKHYIELIKRKTKPDLETIRVSSEQKYRLLTYLSQILISSKKVGRLEEEYFVYVTEQLGADPQATNDCLKLIKHKILGNYLGYKLKEYLGKTNPLFMSGTSQKV
ncbi:response regulator [bacterium]|nr:response regulator [bacterium]